VISGGVNAMLIDYLACSFQGHLLIQEHEGRVW